MVAAKPATKNKAGITYRRPWMYEKQREAFFNDSRYSICEASSKAGKTVGCMAWLLEQAILGKPGQNFWWIAPVYPQARIAFRRMKRGLPKELYEPNESELTLKLANGTTLWFKSGEKPDNLYGEDVYGAVIDEATRCRAEVWYAIRSTLTATRAPARIIGNVKGRKNWAYQMARRAEAGDPAMSYHKITAADAVEAGVLAADEIEDARRTLPESVFRELYLAEPSDDGGNPFGLAAIARCVGSLSSGEAPAVVFGVDLAKSVDWSVVVGLDEDGAVCRFERFQKPWRETLQTVLDVCGYIPTLCDSTGVGDPIVESLQREGGSNFESFKFTSPSKQALMEGLAVAIQSGTVSFPDGPIRSELEEFEYEYSRTGVRYSAPAGLHDDCVMALALAVRAAGTMRAAPIDETSVEDSDYISEYGFSYEELSRWHS